MKTDKNCARFNRPHSTPYLTMRISIVAGIKMIILALLINSSAAYADNREWRFRVLLDEKEIGRHDFILQQQDSGLVLQSEANFEYRLLFVKLYGYEHRATETWSGNCLTGMQSKTDDNGDPFEVSGALQEGQFIVRGNAGVTKLPPCSMSFAYWNPVFLQEEQLINIQNGEVVDIEVSEPEAEQLLVRGELRDAFRYQLRAGKMRIQLWYSDNEEWLALESEARGGRMLRYELL